MKRLLIANRGEIAIRIARAANALGIETVAVYSEDDASSLHVRRADTAQLLPGQGARAYLDIDAVLATAETAGCDALHPGYGFLSENSDFAARCTAQGVRFVGPRAEALAMFGDKVQARALAERCSVPTLRGSGVAESLESAAAFFESLPTGSAVMVKAVGGGGGRGMRIVESIDELEKAYTRCRSEAKLGFGNDAVYLEELIRRARHIEVQVIGDGTGAASHLWERECTLQRRHQKLVEIAPSPELPKPVRNRLTDAAVRMAADVRYDSLGTFEFLVDAQDPERLFFIEANARLQVEHTVTEEVTGIDLVQAQLRVAKGQSLRELGLEQDKISEPRGFAIQCRVNMETMAANGMAKPSGGTLAVFEVPAGPGVRTDTFGYSGYTTSPRFDSLLAKVIVHSTGPDFASALVKTERALGEFRIEGVGTNLEFLRALLSHPDVAAGRSYTRFVEDQVASLLERMPQPEPASEAEAAGDSQLAGVKLNTDDPLALLDYGKSAATPGASSQPDAPPPAAAIVPGPDGTIPVSSPVQGTIVSIDIAEGDLVPEGTQLLVMESMKMEHVVRAPASGLVRQLPLSVGDTVYEGHPLLFLEEREVAANESAVEAEVDLDRIRPDLAEAIERHSYGLDQNRPEAVAKRHKIGSRTARENVDDLCDPGTFIEYGALVIAAQRRRRSLDDLRNNTPSDGMIAGIGSVNGDLFEDAESRCTIVSYDYMVLAGTQGGQNHRKKDRMFHLCQEWKLPLIFFTEGGGGRPGDTDGMAMWGLDIPTFRALGKLSGLVPIVAINSGRCFAGNAAILGCCAVVIATKNSNIGMGGPAMIEGGGLGIFRPEEVGPIEVQAPNGVVDIVVEDEAEAVEVAKKYLSYFQGPLSDWEYADQRLLRNAIPENRLRMYDVREVIETLADTDSVLELRRDYGLGMVTSLVRVEGRPMGVIANNPAHLAGAIDSDGSDKAARFMQLCDAFDIPILMLADTPGMMVGPEVEKTALVRHCSRLFVTGANVTVPTMTIVLRKAYGLGVQAMAAGSFAAPLFSIAWPTAEFGGMGLEGAAKLGHRKELQALTDPAERKAEFDRLVAHYYDLGKAVNTASAFEIDDVIDPADSRYWITRGLKSLPPTTRDAKKRPNIDTW